MALLEALQSKREEHQVAAAAAGEIEQVHRVDSNSLAVVPGVVAAAEPAVAPFAAV